MSLPHALPEGAGALFDRRPAAPGQGHRHARRLPLPAEQRGGRRDRRTICAMSVDANGPGAEARELLSRLVAFDTVNPPGNERAAQEYLADHLAQAGFDCELLGAEPGRPNLLARLRPADGPPPDQPAGGGPTLCLLGHVDTVLADASEWTHDPWSGEVVDGYLWGRGSLDMKSQVAAEVAAAAS